MSWIRSAQRSVVPLIAVAVVGSAGLAACAEPGAPAPANSAGGASSQSQISTTWDLQPVASVVALVPEEFKSKPVTNAIYNNYPPQEFLEGDTLIGIQPDIALALSEVMGVKMQYESVGAFDSLIPGVVSGRYDMSSADFGVTADRLKQVDFVTQFPVGTGFATKKGNSLKVATGTDLCGHTVGVQAGSYYIDQIAVANKDCTAAGKPEINLQAFPDDSARTNAVVNGRIEITASTEDSLAYAINVQNVGMELQPFVYAPLDQGIVIPDGSKLGPAVQAAMQEIVKNGTYGKILEKWNVQNIAYDSPDKVKLLTDPSQAASAT